MTASQPKRFGTCSALEQRAVSDGQQGLKGIAMQTQMLDTCRCWVLEYKCQPLQNKNAATIVCKNRRLVAHAYSSEATLQGEPNRVALYTRFKCYAGSVCTSTPLSTAWPECRPSGSHPLNTGTQADLRAPCSKPV